MATIIQALTFNLATPIDATQTSIPVRNFKDSRGNLITAMIGTLIYMTIEPRSNSNQENISFTGITNNGNGIVTLTGVTRNLNPQPPYTTLGGLIPHGNNAECILSNNPPFYNGFLQSDSDIDITGNFRFPTPTNGSNPATRDYVDNAALLGAGDAMATAKGVTRLSVSPNTTLGAFTVTVASPAVFTLNNHGLTVGDGVQFTTTGALPTGLSLATTYYVISAGLTANTFQVSAISGGSAVNTSGGQSGTHTLIRTTPNAVGTNDPRVRQNGVEAQYALDTGTANNIVIAPNPAITAYATGQVFTIKAATANTGTTTLNVNSLGVKTIKKHTTLTLAAGDIVVGQMFTVIYDGTDFQLLSNIPAGFTTIFTADGTYNVPPWASMLYVEGWGGGGSGAATSNAGGSAESGGGGGGGHRAILMAVSQIGASTVAVTVGQGGAAKNSTGTQALNGDNGGNTTFGSFLVANGGTGGTANATNEAAAAGGTGGTVSGSTIVFLSEAGGAGGAGSSVGAGSAGAGTAATEAGGGGGGAAADTSSGNFPSGAGGTSTRAGAGGAGQAKYSAGNAVATNGGIKGGGGGGAAAYQGNATSGSGGAGLLIVVAM